MKIKGFNFRSYEGTEFIKNQRLHDSLHKKYGTVHITILKTVLTLFTLVIIASLTNLQILNSAYYKNLAENNRVRIKEVKPLRGIIYDRNLVPLVKNKATFTLIAIPVDLYNQNFSIIGIRVIPSS